MTHHPKRRRPARMGVREPSVIRDQKYREWIKEQRCIVTGQPPTEWDGTDPMHIGTAGKGLKSNDNEILPVRHSFHRIAHSHGEMTMFRKHLPDAVLRQALRALAREMYQEYRRENGQ